VGLMGCAFVFLFLSQATKLMPARVRKRGKRGVWREGEGALAHYLRCFKRKRIGRETSLSLSLSLTFSSRMRQIVVRLLPLCAGFPLYLFDLPS